MALPSRREAPEALLPVRDPTLLAPNKDGLAIAPQAAAAHIFLS
jgi:hypothetical protein